MKVQYLTLFFKSLNKYLIRYPTLEPLINSYEVFLGQGIEVVCKKLSRNHFIPEIIIRPYPDEPTLLVVMCERMVVPQGILRDYFGVILRGDPKRDSITIRKDQRGRSLNLLKADKFVIENHLHSPHTTILIRSRKVVFENKGCVMS